MDTSFLSYLLSHYGMVYMMKNNTKHTCQNGFTLIEVMVALAIFAVVSLAIGTLLIQSIRSNTIIWGALQSQNDARRVLESVVNDVRKAEPSSIGSYPIASASSTEFTFFANRDTDSGKERIRYFLNGTTMQKGIIEPGGTPLGYGGAEVVTTIATNVLNATEGIPLFTYYDGSFPVTSTPLIAPIDETDIRAVRIQIVLQKGTQASVAPLYAESVVSIRNLKSN